MKDMKSYDEAIWSWFLPQAIVPSYYGGMDDRETKQVKKHLESCGIDFANSSAPEIGTYEQFAGTFADGNDKLAGIVATYWKCQCDEYESPWNSPQLVVSGEFTLGRIIFEVVQNGLGKSEGDSQGE
jgi:hypothetical protein